MQDGLGLVFEQQGNTGAAAYNEPLFGIGNNPLDMVAAELGQQVQLERINQQRQEKQKAAANQAALNFDLAGWDIDNKAYFTQAYKDIMAQGSQLAAKGYDLNDWSNPEVAAWQRNKADNLYAAQSSKAQEKDFFQNMDFYFKNPDKFDAEATNKNIEIYKQLNPIQRQQFNVNELFVPKQQPLDIYEPLKGVNPQDFGSKFSSEDPTKKSSSTTFSEKKARAWVQGQLKNEIYKPIIEKGIQRQLFKDEKEYEDMLVGQIRSQFVTDISKETKAAPKEWNMSYINSKGANELMGEIGYATDTIKLPTGGSHQYKYTTNLGDINATIGKRGTFNAKTGSINDEQGTYSLKSGKIVMALVDSKTGKPIFGGSGAEQDKKVRDGVAVWKPMIVGKAVDDNGTVKTEEDIWVPADAALATTGENKAMTMGQAALAAYNKKAIDLNQRAKRTATGTQNTQKTNYGLRADGTSKGNGYFGPLKMQDGSNNVATEISIGVNIDGKETEIPTLVPTLTSEEKNWLLKGGNPLDRSPMAEKIVSKAIAHAKERIKSGQSPFAGNATQKTTTKSTHPNYKGDRIMQGGYEYIWNPKTNTYE